MVFAFYRFKMYTTMKYLFNTILLLLVFNAINAQVKKQNPAGYEAVANFTSICCGTVSDDFLKTFVKNYNKTNRKQPAVAYRISGCGREGEFKILFSLSKLTKTNKAKFMTGLKKVVAVQNRNSTAAGQNKGPVNLSYDQSVDPTQGCRGELEKWDIK